MSFRPDKVPNQAFIARLKEARDTLNELKNRQFTSGRSGISAYTSQTANTWDFQGTISTGSPSSGFDTVYILTFAGDGSQQYPMINPFMNVYVGASSPSNRLVPTPAGRSWTDGTNTAVLGSLLVSDTTLLTDPLRLRWTTVVSVYGTVAVYLKAYADGTSPGTIAVVRTA